MLTLGINAAFHDSSACLVRDGVVVAAAEEERFTRIKHAKRPVPFSVWELPYHAIDYCLAALGVALLEVDHVAYALDPALLTDGVKSGETIELPLYPSATKVDGEDPWNPLFRCYVLNAPRQLAGGAPHHIRKRFLGVRHDGPFCWHWVGHHLAHEASAFLAAPFDRCAVLTLDGRGERATTTMGRFVGGRYSRLKQVDYPHSLGLLYEGVTRHLGFLHASDEYKVMALASYGTPSYLETFREMVKLDDTGGYTIEYIDLARCLGPARAPGEPFTRYHENLAASLQAILEECVLALAEWLYVASGERSLAMAGGVALNCVMNAKLRDLGRFDRVWVQPAAGDAGTALGAALWVDHCERTAHGHVLAGDPRPATATIPHRSSSGGFETGNPSRPSLTVPQSPSGSGSDEAGVMALGISHGPTRSAAGDLTRAADTQPWSSTAPAPRQWTMRHAFLGPEYSDDEIDTLLRWTRVAYRRPANIAEACAELLERGQVLGWFQGRMEFGPRALGARSIIASPVDAAMQGRLNELKDREDFRPVAPVVLAERFDDWFEPAHRNGGESSFMLFVYRVRADRAERIPAVRHIDGTARVQTIRREHQPRYYDTISAFGELTGVPLLINTSFNTRGEPIVCTPRDALESFWTSPLDALAIGSFLVEKPR
jgi:carbamoyltransferase